MDKKIKGIVSKYKDKKSSLMNILSDIQKEYGFLSEDLLKELSKEIKMPLAMIYSCASFYSFLVTEKKGKHVIRVCNSPSCHINGSLNILTEVERLAKGNSNLCVEKTSCIGCCDEAPAMMIDDKVYTKLTKEKVKEIVETIK